eukprot:TRINITY_DN7888_c0_g1_i1.p1 TRINITY_DN7888_c0_g1~~TRINITY_DN7888_c0_g1_i1.p1  ORF type:complete len:358 (-),score=42.80 TRINITY_DN7888_c0_g1_i1:16-1089(-)
MQKRLLNLSQELTNSTSQDDLDLSFIDLEDSQDTKLQQSLEVENLSIEEQKRVQARQNWQRLIRKVLLAKLFVEKMNKSRLISKVANVVSQTGGFLIVWPYLQIAIATSMLACANSASVLPYEGFIFSVQRITLKYGLSYLYRGWLNNYLSYLVPSVLEDEVKPVVLNKVKEADGKIKSSWKLFTELLFASVHSIIVTPLEILSYKLLLRAPSDVYTDFWSCCSATYKEDGIAGFFKGFGLSMLDGVIVRIINNLALKLPVPGVSVLSWALTVVASYPIATVRARLIVYKNGNHEGIKGFYRGFGTMFWMIPGLVTWYFLFGFMRFLIRKFWLNKLRDDTELAEYARKIRKIQGKED